MFVSTTLPTTLSTSFRPTQPNSQTTPQTAFQIPAHNSQAPSVSLETPETQHTAPENNGTGIFPSPLTPPPANRHLEILELHKKKQAKSKKETEKFFSAIEGGNLETVEQLVRENEKNLFRTMEGGIKPLHVAAQYGHYEIVEFLIEKGVDLNACDESGQSPLQVAAFFGRGDIVEFLVNNEAKLCPNEEDGETAIHAAAAGGHNFIIKFLVTKYKDAKLDAISRKGGTPLIRAVLNGHLHIVKHLVKNGIKLDNTNNQLMMYAAAKGHRRVVEYLIDNGCKVNETDADGNTALHSAAFYGKSEMAKFLVSRDASLNCFNNEGNTAMHIAVNVGCLELVRFLIEKGVDVNLGDQRRNTTPLIFASFKGHLEIVKLLFNNGANPNFITNNGCFALSASILNNHYSVAESLIDNTKDLYVLDQNGMTILHMALVKGNLEIVKLILSRGFDLNHVCPQSIQEISGKTALMCAAAGIDQKQLDIIKFLVDEIGVDLHQTDKSGATALHYAGRAGMLDVVEFLIEKGLDVNQAALNGITVLYEAARFRRDHLVNALIQKGVRLDSDFNLEQILQNEPHRQHRIVSGIGMVWFSVLTAPTVLMNKKKELEKTGQLLEHTEIMELARLRNNAQILIDRLSSLTDDALMLRLAGVTLFSPVDFESESLKNHPYLKQLFNIEKWLPEEERREAFLEKLSIQLGLWDSDGIKKYGQGEMSIFHSEYARLPQITKSILEKLDY